MKKIKITLLHGLLFFTTATQLPAAQKELLEAGSSRRNDVHSDNLFAAALGAKKDDGLSLNVVKKTTKETGTQTNSETLSESALTLLYRAGNVLRSRYDFGSAQDTATAAVVVSLGLKAFGNRSIGGTKIEQILILTGVLEGVAASYAMTREGSRYKEWLPVSVICGLSTCAAFAEKKDFTQHGWGKTFGLFTLGSSLGTAVYEGLRWLKKPSTNRGSFQSDTTLAIGR